MPTVKQKCDKMPDSFRKKAAVGSSTVRFKAAGDTHLAMNMPKTFKQ